MSVAIRVSHLSKHYKLGQTSQRASYRTLRESLMEMVGNLRRRGQSDRSTTDFWALKGVDFEVESGEVVGLIGRNGAGKSTLLKVLSRITKPTTGRVELHGRVGSLLEVGTGFHPELTGRENVFLNGSILGMSRREITRRFDEIVAFAEVEQFLDTPVKRYSSGMYVRLAFAVAAHLEPEILLVDEVLAVGDTSFQKKCLGKMNEISRAGRTVFFVSHNMQAVESLTTRCIAMEAGRVKFDGPTSETLRDYIRSLRQGALGAGYLGKDEPLNNYVASARIVTSESSGEHTWGEPIEFEFVIHVGKPSKSLCFSFYVANDRGQQATHLWLFEPDAPFRGGPGDYTIRCVVPRFRLYMGDYTLTTWLSDRSTHTIFENLTDLCPFTVTMHGWSRPEYDWEPGMCVYLEDFHWEYGPAEVAAAMGPGLSEGTPGIGDSQER